MCGRARAESVEAKCVHRHPGPHRGDGQRFLAHDLAGERQCHHNADQGVRFYKGERQGFVQMPLGFFLLNRAIYVAGDVYAILAAQTGQDRAIWRHSHWHR